MTDHQPPRDLDVIGFDNVPDLPEGPLTRCCGCPVAHLEHVTGCTTPTELRHHRGHQPHDDEARP